MYRDTRVGVVVPAYNESALVGTVVETMPEFVDRIYVVDDRSTDDTWEHVRRAAEQANRRAAENGRGSRGGRGERTDGDRGRSRSRGSAVAADSATADGGVAVGDRVVPIRHEENLGVGGAITTGYRRALADGVDVVAVMNGDAQMDPDELPRLLDPVVEGRADYAKGNRLLQREFRDGMTGWRLFGNWLLTFLTKLASGYWKTMDPQNGYTAISREALETIGTGDFYTDYGFCNDVLVKLNAYGFTVADVPMPAVYGDETSSIRYSSFVPKLSALLLKGFVWRLHTKYLVRDFHPLALCYLFGVASLAVGTLAGVGATVGGLAGFESADVTTAVLVPVGCLALLAAMTLDMQANRDREVRAE
ncbi:glycosyltransferase family 2 protein (plasmid) [Halorussus limi]|uniref:Glycosyltransferase family 2 protein n=1 Tax=Halorussus limi TaxID=2938695 RepID=A0A8U0I1Q8_9EURY|nr:glycosyltransferase family 2 protein [Halorussus limi]UPV76856.1 glycosyltransferase family 2 protein [Halorussus limi]